jgi:hypothetical protein
MAVGTIFGAHTARVRRVPLFGVLLAGVVGGLGGGIARDLLLGLEPAAIANWYYVPAILAAAVVGALTARQVSLSPLPFVAAQAVALGLLITIGVQKAVAYHTPGPSAVLIGVVAATTGAVVVDQGDALSGNEGERIEAEFVCDRAAEDGGGQNRWYVVPVGDGSRFQTERHVSGHASSKSGHHSS